MVSKTTVQLAAVFVAALSLGACSGSSTPSAGATGVTTAPGTPSATPTVLAPASPAATKKKKHKVKPAPIDTATPSVAISKAPPVAVGKPAELTEGIKVTIGPITSVKVKANGPGEIAGAAASVPITVQNASGKSFSLDGFSITASYAKGTPASPTSAAPAKPLSGTLKVGQKADGVYVFTVSKAEADSLKVEVSSSSAATILVFKR